MAVTEQTPINTSLANGVTTVFPYGFLVIRSEDLKVQVGVALQTEGVDYSVTGIGVASGGDVTFVSPPADGSTVLVYRSSQIKRETDYQDNGDLPASTVNLDFDRIWLVFQELFAGLFGDLPTPGDATTLRGELANGTDLAKGASMVAYDADQSVREAIDDLIASGDQHVFTGSGELGDDTAAIAAFYAALPRYSIMKIKGFVRVTATTTFGRQIGIVCESANDAFIVDVGIGNDGIVVRQPTALDELGVDTVGGINGIPLKIHVFGKANACKDALVVGRCDRSEAIYTWVYAGAVGYGLVCDGCLINDWTVQSSIYVKPPITSPAFQVDHMLVKKNTTYSVASNTNLFRVNLEGGRHGFVQTAQAGEGANTVTGEMEALLGAPFTVSNALGFTVHDLKMEVCALQSTFDGVENLHIGPGVVNFASTTPWVGPGKIKITNSQSVYVGGYYGSLDIDDTNIGVELGTIESPSSDSHTLSCRSMVQTGVFTNSSNRTTFAGPGAPTMENTFSNPYFDLWASCGIAPAAGTGPIGVTPHASTAVARLSGAAAYEGNESGFYMAVATGTTGFSNGVTLGLSFNPVNDSGYWSVMLAVKSGIGQPGVIAFIYDGVTLHQIGATTAGTGNWVVFRGSAKAIAGNNLQVLIASWNGATYPSGAEFFVGGCSIVQGPIPPMTLADHGRRRANIIGTIAKTPDFSGQCAITGGGVYFAQGNASSADWKGPV